MNHVTCIGEAEADVVVPVVGGVGVTIGRWDSVFDLAPNRNSGEIFLIGWQVFTSIRRCELRVRYLLSLVPHIPLSLLDQGVLERRKPTLPLLLLVGRLFRLVTRKPSRSLPQPPPRITRSTPDKGP